MIICSCNVLSDRDIGSAARNGVCQLSQVYKSRNCRVECGRCVPKVLCILRQEIEKFNDSKSEREVGKKLEQAPV